MGKLFADCCSVLFCFNIFVLFYSKSDPFTFIECQGALLFEFNILTLFPGVPFKKDLMLFRVLCKQL